MKKLLVFALFAAAAVICFGAWLAWPRSPALSEQNLTFANVQVATLRDVVSATGLVEPREVVFPGLGFPAEAERLAFRQRLYDQYGLTYALSYQQLNQYATQTLPRVRQNWAIGGWAAPSMTWTPLDRGGDYQGSLVFRPGWRGPIGNNPWPAPFGPANLGSAWSAYEFTSWNDHFEIEDLLRACIAALVLRQEFAVLAKLNYAGVGASLNHGTRLQRHRVEVGEHLRTARLIHLGKADFG